MIFQKKIDKDRYSKALKVLGLRPTNGNEWIKEYNSELSVKVYLSSNKVYAEACCIPPEFRRDLALMYTVSNRGTVSTNPDKVASIGELRKFVGLIKSIADVMKSMGIK